MVLRRNGPFWFALGSLIFIGSMYSAPLMSAIQPSSLFATVFQVEYLLPLAIGFCLGAGCLSFVRAYNLLRLEHSGFDPGGGELKPCESGVCVL